MTSLSRARRWYVSHTDILYYFWPGQKVVVKPDILPEWLRDEPRSTPHSCGFLKAMKEQDGVAKINRVWVEDDGQLMTTLGDGSIYIPAQYLLPLSESSKAERRNPMDDVVAGIVASIRNVNDK